MAMQKRKIENESPNGTKRKKTEKAIITAMAQDRGYIIIQRKKSKLQEDNEFPPKKLFEALENEIGKERFQDLRRSTLALPGVPIDGGEASEALLNYGIDFSDPSDPELNPFFQDVLGCSFCEADKAMLKVIFWARNETKLRRYTAGRPSTAYIYCPATAEGLNDGNGLFRIVEGSHKMTRGNIDRTEATPICLQSNEILIMSAELMIESLRAEERIEEWIEEWITT
ncbi:hypothetical protein I7I51_06449 [Histoplasma capsulatum]|uniref:Uncharacterized protein n=1 Tax=Ajellomyces capsulatus TaxID=5037 RepID=A0A8A1MLU0_AJECA|nr:hypothetical protein I7I51_06449 [Histoplasma capsulatum]